MRIENTYLLNYIKNNKKILFISFLILLTIIITIIVFFQKKPAQYDEIIVQMDNARDYTILVDDAIGAYSSSENRIGTPAYNGFLGIIDENTPKEVVEVTERKYSQAIEQAKEIKQRVLEQEQIVRNNKGVVSLTDLQYLTTRADPELISSEFPKIDIELARKMLQQGESNPYHISKHEHEHEHEHEHHAH